MNKKEAIELANKIKRIRRYKYVFDKKNNGQTFVSIAKEMNLSPTRVRELYHKYENTLRVRAARRKHEFKRSVILFA